MTDTPSTLEDKFEESALRLQRMALLNDPNGFVSTLEDIIKQELQRFASEVEKEVIETDERFDTLDNTEKKYTAQDMELIAVQMRNKLRKQQRERLSALKTRYGLMEGEKV